MASDPRPDAYSAHSPSPRLMSPRRTPPRTSASPSASTPTATIPGSPPASAATSIRPRSTRSSTALSTGSPRTNNKFCCAPSKRGSCFLSLGWETTIVRMTTGGSNGFQAADVPGEEQGLQARILPALSAPTLLRSSLCLVMLSEVAATTESKHLRLLVPFSLQQF